MGYDRGRHVSETHDDLWLTHPRVRAGLNYYPWKNHVVRVNTEYIYQDRCPVGGLSLPYQVGGTGSILHANFQVNF